LQEEDTFMERRDGMFWSGESLIDRLPELIDPFSPDRVDCAAYTLAIGPEVYVSPTDETADPTSVTVRRLAEEEAFTIPPGQFAFLLTEEVVSVPSDSLALISIRAKSKFRGLVNVSGFHVDPGYRGQLTFAVFNAGPVTIHLKRGQPIFLIWYANLDRATKYKKSDEVHRGIDTELITSVGGELLSFAGLAKKIKDVDKDLAERIHAIEKDQTYYRVIAAIALAVAIAVATVWVKDFFGSKAPAPVQNITAPSAIAPAPATPPVTAPASKSQ
jgi:dCTP deaminase